jgi:hypothetical protein
MSRLYLVARCAPLILANMTTVQPLPAQVATRQAAVVDVKGMASPAPARLERIQRLAHRSDSLGRALKAALSQRYLVRLTDTVHAGFFMLLTTPDLRVEVQQAAERAWLAIAPRIDEVTRDSLARTPIRVRAPRDDEHEFMDKKELLIIRDTPSAHRSWPGGDTRVARHGLHRALLQIASTVASTSMDSQLRTWGMITELPLVAATAGLENAARLEVATAPSRAARECWVGTIAACARLLLLSVHPDSALGAWYGAEDYRGAVQRLRLGPADVREAPALQRRCLDQRDDGACEGLLHSLSPDRVPSPVFAEPRVLLIDEALAAGGKGALDRLRNSTGTIGERLSATSGLPITALLTRWQTRLVAGRRRDLPPSFVLTVAALGWTVLFGSLALRGARRCS